MLSLKHKKLDVWKLAIEFVLNIYRVTENFPKSEIYGLTNQLRRAAVSVVSNIAEGASRVSPVERNRFFEISRSSLVEIDTQLEVALKLSYFTEESLKPLGDIMNHLFAMISNLIKRTK